MIKGLCPLHYLWQSTYLSMRADFLAPFQLVTFFCLVKILEAFLHHVGNFYFDCNFAWHDCSAPIWKGTLLSKHSCQLLLFRLEWEDVNFNWIGKQTLMPVQIGAATHKQPSNPSNMITQQFWANQNQSSNFRFLIFMKYNGFILTCCKQYALESYFSQHGKHWRKHHRGWGSGGGSLQVVELHT